MRVKRGVTAHKKHKKILKAVKGYSKPRRSSSRMARQGMYKALSYAYRDRRNRKRNFRQLWITRISAAASAEGISYSKLTNQLKLAKIELNRKTLAELAVNSPDSFKAVVETAKKAK